MAPNQELVQKQGKPIQLFQLTRQQETACVTIRKQTFDLPRDHVDAENALRDAESLRRNDELGRQAQQTSSSSTALPFRISDF
jgi:hypothetical protein